MQKQSHGSFQTRLLGMTRISHSCQFGVSKDDSQELQNTTSNRASCGKLVSKLRWVAKRSFASV
jgi:hypothetical protein